MPYLFFMVLPMMMWDALMLPPNPESIRGEPWGRLTP